MNGVAFVVTISRKVPDGYRRSILQNDDLITSEDLFSWERMKTIVAMNLGLYNHMIPAEH